MYLSNLGDICLIRTHRHNIGNFPTTHPNKNIVRLASFLKVAAFQLSEFGSTEPENIFTDDNYKLRVGQH